MRYFKRLFKLPVLILLLTLALRRYLSMSTKNKILDAAENLFADKGFNGTSLREITSQAEVNLARLELALTQVCDTDSPSLIDVFSAFIDPLLSLNEFKDNGTSNFLQLLGRGYTDSQGFLRWFLTTQYPEVIDNFVLAVQKAYPELTAEEMFWRLHFTMGTVVFTMSSSDALIDIAKSDFERNLQISDVIRNVIPYVAAGVGAPMPILS